LREGTISHKKHKGFEPFCAFCAFCGYHKRSQMEVQW
jgi:hypothetical protein